MWVLNLLERDPMNGAEIMEQMDRMTMGWWRPSPGSIYPLLEQLQKERIVEKMSDGRYQLTEEARVGPEWMRGRNPFGPFSPPNFGPRTPEDATRELEAYVRYLEDSLRSQPGAVAQQSERIRGIARRLDVLAGGVPPSQS